MATDRADEIARETLAAFARERETWAHAVGVEPLIDGIAAALRSYGDSLLEEAAVRLDEDEERAAKIVRAFKTSPTQENDRT